MGAFLNVSRSLYSGGAPIFTFDQLLGMTEAELANVQELESTGNLSFLPSASASNEIADKAWGEMVTRIMLEKIAQIATGQALGAPADYLYAYADISVAPTVLPYATKSISPRPTSANQITLWKNGDRIVSGRDWTYGTSGVTLAVAAVSGDTFIMTIWGDDLGRAKYEFGFDGSYGTGSGNRIFTLADLAADKDGNAITRFPASSSRLWVFLNGMRVWASGNDYTLTGTGSSTVVTFVNSLTVDDDVDFIIWSAD